VLVRPKIIDPELLANLARSACGFLAAINRG
jgi:hypothetical protein